MHSQVTYHAALAHIDDLKREAAAQRQRIPEAAQARFPFRRLAFASRAARTPAGPVAPAPARPKVA